MGYSGHKSFGPTLVGPTLGPLKYPPSVSQSSDKSPHTSHHHYFFLIFCIRLAFSKSRKVTNSDFRRKKCPGPKSGQTGPNRAQNEVFVQFLEFASLDFAHFPYIDRLDQYLQLLYWHHGRKKMSRAFRGHFRSKIRARDRFFFLPKSTFFFDFFRF